MSNPVGMPDISDGPKRGQLAPDFSLPDRQGHLYTLSLMRGHIMHLAFFCGCDRCKAAAKRIATLQHEGKMGDFVSVVALVPDAAAEFIRSTGIRGTALADPDETVETVYQSSFCPRLWVIGADGKIAYRSDIALEGADLDKALRDLESAHVVERPQQ